MSKALKKSKTLMTRAMERQPKKPTDKPAKKSFFSKPKKEETVCETLDVIIDAPLGYRVVDLPVTNQTQDAVFLEGFLEDMLSQGYKYDSILKTNLLFEKIADVGPGQVFKNGVIIDKADEPIEDSAPEQ